MEKALDALSNERERKMNEPVRLHHKNVKLSRVYANPSQDKVLAATMIQVNWELRGILLCSLPPIVPLAACDPALKSFHRPPPSSPSSLLGTPRPCRLGIGTTETAWLGPVPGTL